MISIMQNFIVDIEKYIGSSLPVITGGMKPNNYIIDMDRSSIYGSFVTTVILTEPQPNYEIAATSRYIISELRDIATSPLEFDMRLDNFDYFNKIIDNGVLCYDTGYKHIFDDSRVYNDSYQYFMEQKFITEIGEDNFDFGYNLEMDFLNKTEIHGGILYETHKKCTRSRLVFRWG